jgi:RND family efflux transporter MFP subunit
MRPNRWWNGVLLAACAVSVQIAPGVGTQARAQGGPPPGNVTLDAVRFEPIAQQREVTGSVRARRSATVAAQEPGLVAEIALEAGDAVKAGQVLARLDDELARLDLRRAEAEAASAQATIDRARAELDDAASELSRLEQLDQRGSSSVGELDRARNAERVAQAELAEAEATLATRRAELEQAAKRLKDMTIVAPFAGVVTRKQTEVGQWLSVGDTVLSLVETDALEAWIDVPEAFVGLLRPDAPVSVTLRGLGASVEGALIAVVPQADELSRLFPVRLRVPASLDDGRAVRPGMSVVALVPTTDVAPTLTIAKDAILRNEAGEFVYFDAGGTAAVAPVQRLFAVDAERVAVRSPALRGGTLVVIEGNERMFPGQSLNVLNAEQFPEVLARVRAAAGADGQNTGGPASERPNE